VIFSSRTFAELNVYTLYDILCLRQRVFVVEQHSAYLDGDGLDPQALHLLAEDENVLVGYARIVPPAQADDAVRIGRLVIAPEQRGKGLGTRLMRQAMELACKHYGGVIAISAQTYLEPFYEALGFARAGEPQDEAGVSHVAMQRPCSAHAVSL